MTQQRIYPTPDAYNSSQIKLLTSLLEADALLKWLHECQPIMRSAVPPESSAALKQLEDLGLVSRRNANALVVQEHRLQRLLCRLIQRVPDDLMQRCQQSFGWLSLPFSVTAEASSADDKPIISIDEPKVEARAALDLAPNQIPC